jgi:hypothetical protein
VNDFVTVSATVLVLEESVQFVREADSSISDNLRCDKIRGQDLASHEQDTHMGLVCACIRGAL